MAIEMVIKGQMAGPFGFGTATCNGLGNPVVGAGPLARGVGDYGTTAAARWPLTYGHRNRRASSPLGILSSTTLNFEAAQRYGTSWSCHRQLSVADFTAGPPRREGGVVVKQPLPTRHCQTQARRNGLVILFRALK